MTGDTAQRALEVIDKRVETIRTRLRDRIGPILSSENVEYDYEYKIARRRVSQDHDKNKDLIKNS